jgi:hypothetical protein
MLTVVGIQAALMLIDKMKQKDSSEQKQKKITMVVELLKYDTVKRLHPPT